MAQVSANGFEMAECVRHSLSDRRVSERELMETMIGRRAASEGIGTALLLVAVVGSGIMGKRLAGGNVAIALLSPMPWRLALCS